MAYQLWHVSYGGKLLRVARLIRSDENKSAPRPRGRTPPASTSRRPPAPPAYSRVSTITIYNAATIRGATTTYLESRGQRPSAFEKWPPVPPAYSRVSTITIKGRDYTRRMNVQG